LALAFARHRGCVDRRADDAWEAAVSTVVICLTVIASLGIGFAMGVRFVRLRRDSY
jgi:hypothetical protein